MRLFLVGDGTEPTEATWRAIASSGSPVRLKLRGPAFPLNPSDVLWFHPLVPGSSPPPGLLLFRSGDGFRLGLHRSPGTPEDGAALGRVVAVERGVSTFSLDRGFLSHVPLAWLSRAMSVLEALGRLRHPLTPPLFLGNAEASLAGVQAKYDQPGEAWEYSHLAPTELNPVEREIMRRFIPPGGRLLDIGCGAGREAIGFARAGYRVVGIDVAPRMIDAARASALRAGLAVSFRVQSITELDEPAGSFDAAYWAGSYHHVPGRTLRIATLRRIMRSLTPEGTLVLMVVYRGKRGLISRSRLVDFLRRLLKILPGGRRLSEPGDGYMCETSEASDPRIPCFFHDFSASDEVRAEIEAAGLLTDEIDPGWWVCRRRPDTPDS